MTHLDNTADTALSRPRTDSEGSVASPRMSASALPRWFCVATLSNLEHMAKAGLQGIGLETLFLQTATQTAGGWKVRSLFPGYGFVRFSVETDPWHRISDVPGVYRLFKHGPESPTALPRGTVEAFQAAADASGVIYPQATPLPPPGAVCRLLEGPLVNLTGICAWSQGDRIRLLMNLLGGHVTISVAASAVRVVG